MEKMKLKSAAALARASFLGSLKFSAVLALSTTVLLLWIGFQHNPQGEFYSDDRIEFGYITLFCLLNFSAFLLVTSMVLSVASFSVRLIWKFARK